MPSGDTPAPHEPPERWKPTIYWWTPIAMVISAACLIGVVALIVRRWARAAEKSSWPEHLQDKRDGPDA